MQIGNARNPRPVHGQPGHFGILYQGDIGVIRGEPVAIKMVEAEATLGVDAERSSFKKRIRIRKILCCMLQKNFGQSIGPTVLSANLAFA